MFVGQKFFGPLKMKKKLIFGLLKIKKLVFSKNQKSQIWWTIGGGQDSATGHPDTLRTFGSIRFLQVSVLASVDEQLTTPRSGSELARSV